MFSFNLNNISPNSISEVLKSFNICELNYIEVQEIYSILRHEHVEFSPPAVSFLSNLREKTLKNAIFNFEDAPKFPSLNWVFWPFENSICLKLTLRFNHESSNHDLKVSPTSIPENCTFLEVFNLFGLPHSEQVIDSVLVNKFPVVIGTYCNTAIKINFD